MNDPAAQRERDDEADRGAGTGAASEAAGVPLGRDDFVRELSAIQRPLYAYIYTLVPDMTDADDILQDTNLAMWRKFDEGVAVRHFLAMGRELARFAAMTHVKRRKRDRLRFDDDLMGVMAAEWSSDDDARFEDRRGALRRCLGKLPEQSRVLVRERYLTVGSVQAMAQRLGKPVGAVSQALYRIRSTLAECIGRTLGREGQS